jgi:hypothetical protein
VYHEFWHCQTDGTEAKDKESSGEVHDESSCTQCCVDFAVRRDEKMPAAIDTELVSLRSFADGNGYDENNLLILYILINIKDTAYELRNHIHLSSQ